MTFRAVEGHWKWSTDKRTGELNEQAQRQGWRKLSLICFKAHLHAVAAAQGIKINDDEFKM